METQQQASTIKLAFVTFLCFVCWRVTVYFYLPIFIQWLFLGLFGFGVYKTTWFAFLDWRLWQFFKHAPTPTGLYGRTDHVGANELVLAGLKTSNADGNGIPIGAIGETMYFYDGDSHISVRAATGGGKTESSFAPICFALGAHRNILATGKGREPPCLVADYRKSLGQDVIIIDIGNQMGGTGLKVSDFNPIGHLVGFAERNDPKLIDEARKVSATLIPEPKGGAGGDNIFFRNQARKWKTWLLCGVAVLEAMHGELICNLPALYSKINSDDDELKAFLTELTTLDQLDGSIRGAANRILSKWRNSPKTFESVLSEVENALEIYDPTSHLGQSSIYSQFDPYDIKRKPTSIFLVTDPTQSETHGIAAGLALDVLTNIALQANSFEPRLTIIADEFANLSNRGALPSILPTLYVGRSLGVQLITYVQDTSSYEDRYGQEASAFTTQCEITIVSKCLDVDEAENYSKRSGDISVMTESLNLPQGMESDPTKSYSVSLSEQGIPRLRADEFLQLDNYRAALFYKQLPAVMFDLVSYKQVLPWRDQAGTVPDVKPQDELPIRFQF